MDLILDGLRGALSRLGRGDPEVIAVTLMTLRVSTTALLISLFAGVPIGAWLATAVFRGRRMLVSLANTGMGLPPVVVGLLVALVLWRSGPLGALELMYTPAAMIVAQSIIALPITIALTVASIQQLGPRLPLQLRALGASWLQEHWVLIRQARIPLLAVAMATAGRLLAEVGAVMMVGGNLEGETRVLTTATVLETRRGRFDLALSLGFVLLLLTFFLNWALTQIQQRVASR